MYDFEDDNPSLIKRMRFMMRRMFLWIPHQLGAAGEWFDRLWRRMFARGQMSGEGEHSGNFSAVLAWIGWLPRKLLSGTDRVERGFRKASVGLGEGASGADSGFRRLLKGIFGPIFVTINQFLTILFSPVSTWLQSNRFAQLILKSTHWVWYPMVAIASFGQTFWHTRKWAAIILFLVLVVPATLLTFITWRVGRQQSMIAKDYRKAVEDAVSRGDLDQAQMLRFKLQALGVRADRFEMQQVNSLAQAGKIEEAIASAENLAPLDKLGMIEAHFWLIQQYLGDQSKSGMAASNAKAAAHLELLTKTATANSKGGATPPQIVFLTAMLEFKKGNVVNGINLLQSTDNYWPAVAKLLEVHALMGKKEESMKCALWLLKAMKNNRQMIDEIDEKIFPPLSVAASRYGTPSDVEEIVSAWNRRFPQNKMANASNSRLILQEVESLVIQGTEPDLKLAAQKLVSAANGLDEDFVGVLNKWMFVRMAGTNETEMNYKKLFDEVESLPNLSANMLETLGAIAVNRGNDSKGLELLKRSIELSPRNANAWNSIAYLTLKSGDNLEYALQAAENAINLAPDNHLFYNTRGMANLRLKNWQSAIDDLKRAISHNPNSQAVHRGLAQAYGEIGEKELATFHLGQAERSQ